MNTRYNDDYKKTIIRTITFPSICVWILAKYTTRNRSFLYTYPKLDIKHKMPTVAYMKCFLFNSDLESSLMNCTSMINCNLHKQVQPIFIEFHAKILTR